MFEISKTNPLRPNQLAIDCDDDNIQVTVCTDQACASSAVVSHISRRTSEIWGTRASVEGT